MEKQEIHNFFKIIYRYLLPKSIADTPCDTAVLLEDLLAASAGQPAVPLSAVIKVLTTYLLSIYSLKLL